MISTTAHRGRDPRPAGNSKRSMTGTRRVSDSLLKPAMKNGELRTVRDVEMIGEVYVRIAGREDIASVALTLFNIERDTMKFPAGQQRCRTKYQCRDCSSCEAIQFLRMLRMVDC